MIFHDCNERSRVMYVNQDDPDDQDGQLVFYFNYNKDPRLDYSYTLLIFILLLSKKSENSN